MANWTQDTRHIAINTPLGKDVLLLKSFTYRDEMSRPFQCDLELRSQKADVDFNKIIGQNVTIRLNQTRAGQVRYFNGYISRFVQEGDPVEGSANHYRATMVPWTWLLTRTTDCKIYQNKKIQDIVQEVFDCYQFGDYEFRLTATYQPKEFIVQYRESAFNFVSRLLEHEGIYYFFEHDNGKHLLVLTDSPAKHKEASEDYKEVTYNPATTGNIGMERLWDWTVEKKLQTGKIALTDYDFKAPTKKMLVNKDAPQEHAYAKFEAFDYPGMYVEHAHGETYAAVRGEEISAQFALARSTGDVRGLFAGCKFKLLKYPRGDQNIDHVVVSSTIFASTDEFDTGAGGGNTEAFKTSLASMPADKQFRPARTTSKPRVAGPQTAIVVGPSGEEIHTDTYGRVKVQFHWDRYGKYDENSSCWIRVSNNWAGKKWGGIFLPRIGQEVIVDFLEGDPDQPVITGRVYNNDQMPPYALPGSKNISGIKSDTTKGGGGYNEIHFDDTKGSEKITIHAQKDMNTTVEHDQTDTVHNNRTITVEGTHTETITKDTTIKISEGKLLHDVVAGTATYHVKGAIDETYDATQTTTVKEKITIQSTTADIDANAKTSIKVHTGETAVVDLIADGGKIGIAANDTVQISCGPCVIQMKKDGTLKISATKIEIAGAAESKFGVGNQQITADVAKLGLSGAMINSSAVGIHEIAGAIVKIN